MRAAEQAAQVRRTAGLFRLADRALLAVAGGDRVRWLDGMLTNDVSSLGPARSGCHAVALTRTGRVVAEVHVLWRPEELWLELEAAALAGSRSHLERFIIADDVTLRDRSDECDRLGLEGPAAPSVLASAAGRPVSPAPHACEDVSLGGFDLTVAAYGWSGEPAFQLLAPRGSGDALAAALLGAGASAGLVEAGPEALEILRIEAGCPRHGCELDESVLPDEARLSDAVSSRKGCYTGQEVVARLRSRGHPSHLLVGLAVDGESPLPTGATVTIGGRAVGQVTSSCVSPSAGSIALGFLKRDHAAEKNRVWIGGQEARVTRLPFAGPGAAGP